MQEAEDTWRKIRGGKNLRGGHVVVVSEAFSDGWVKRLAGNVILELTQPYITFINYFMWTQHDMSTNDNTKTDVKFQLCFILFCCPKAKP